MKFLSSRGWICKGSFLYSSTYGKLTWIHFFLIRRDDKSLWTLGKLHGMPRDIMEHRERFPGHPREKCFMGHSETLWKSFRVASWRPAEDLHGTQGNGAPRGSNRAPKRHRKIEQKAYPPLPLYPHAARGAPWLCFSGYFPQYLKTYHPSCISPTIIKTRQTVRK